MSSPSSEMLRLGLRRAGIAGGNVIEQRFLGEWAGDIAEDDKTGKDAHMPAIVAALLFSGADDMSARSFKLKLGLR